MFWHDIWLPYNSYPHLPTTLRLEEVVCRNNTAHVASALLCTGPLVASSVLCTGLCSHGATASTLCATSPCWHEATTSILYATALCKHRATASTLYASGLCEHGVTASALYATVSTLYATSPFHCSASLLRVKPTVQ